MGSFLPDGTENTDVFSGGWTPATGMMSGVFGGGGGGYDGTQFELSGLFSALQPQVHGPQDKYQQVPAGHFDNQGNFHTPDGRVYHAGTEFIEFMKSQPTYNYVAPGTGLQPNTINANQENVANESTSNKGWGPVGDAASRFLTGYDPKTETVNPLTALGYLPGIGQLATLGNLIAGATNNTPHYDPKTGKITYGTPTKTNPDGSPITGIKALPTFSGGQTGGAMGGPTGDGVGYQGGNFGGGSIPFDPATLAALATAGGSAGTTGDGSAPSDGTVPGTTAGGTTPTAGDSAAPPVTQTPAALPPPPQATPFPTADTSSPLYQAMAAMLSNRSRSPMVTNPFGALNPVYLSQAALGAGAPAVGTGSLAFNGGRRPDESGGASPSPSPQMADGGQVAGPDPGPAPGPGSNALPPVPGWGGTLPWQQPAPQAPVGAPGSWALPAGGGPSALPPGVQMPVPPPGGQPGQRMGVSRETPPPSPMAGLAQAGAMPNPGATQGLPPPSQPPGMADGGQVPPHIRITPRHTPIFKQVMRELHLHTFADGGPVRPVIFSDRPGYADGGLVQAAHQVKGAGRYGDSILVHLNASEFKELERNHGPHSVNPETGLPEFGWFGNLLKSLAPIAAIAIPGLGAEVGGLLGGTGGFLGSAAPAIGSALVGAGLGAVTNGGTGALIGGLTGGLGSMYGDKTANWLHDSLGIGSHTSQALVNALLGAGGSGAAGGNPLQGGLMAGALSAFAPETAGKIKNAFSPSTDTPSSMIGGQSMSGGDSGGAMSKWVPGAADAVVGTGSASSSGEGSAIGGLFGLGGGSGKEGGLNMQSLLPLMLLASAVGGSSGPKVYTTPPPAQPTSTGFNPTPQHFSFGLERNPAYDPSMASQYPFMAGAPSYFLPASTVPHQMADGGALHAAAVAQPSPAARAGAIRGAGGGKEDLIDAKLSAGEHVIPAQDVSSLGDGSNDEGHRRLEIFKQEIRKNVGQKNPKRPTKEQPPLHKMIAKARGAK